ncbi:MAG TPA: NAD(P)/FAD-dependent oxidoreductase [Thermomicrobiales bacterium]|nr:NAD(P)/FAD-dependent oxidoreductase [Thermomicrobiales bacterium]
MSSDQQEQRVENEGPVAQFVSVDETLHAPSFNGGKPRVVIVGGGFAGLNAAKALDGAAVEVLLIDRRNHHLFAPLLYQVATAQLSPANIAQPIRGILRRQKNLSVLLAEVVGVEVNGRRVRLDDGRTVDYDYLILAAGATHSYFGNDQWAPLAPGLKTIEDALTIRRRILLAFEDAEREPDPARRASMLTFVIVGGGPTGVELAGAIGELANHTLARDFQHIDPRDAHILLLEGLPQILPMFNEKLARQAVEDLERFGVEVRTNSLVTAIDPEGVNVGDERIPTHNVFWAAGVSAAPVTRSLAGVAELDRAGRATVTRELNIPGHPEIFVIGDAASAPGENGKPLPGVAPVAIQEGQWVACNMRAALEGNAYAPFRYRDQGSMATIGRNRAIADVKGLEFTGFVAWLAWALVHVAQLIGFRNRLMVGAQWLFNYFTYRRGARLITGELSDERRKDMMARLGKRSGELPAR